MSTQGLRGGATHRAVGFLDPLFLVTKVLVKKIILIHQNQICISHDIAHDHYEYLSKEQLNLRPSNWSPLLG